jgi:uncharacterized protein (TIGR03083 family)
MIRKTFLAMAQVTLDLICDVSVVDGWSRSSALRGFTVGGLAAHLGGQVTEADAVLSGDASPDDVIDVTEHYQRGAQVLADWNSELNVAIREAGEQSALAGPGGVADLTTAALERLRQRLPAEPRDRVIDFPWTPWNLTLDDFLAAKTLELVVHSDDLAVSVGLPTPEMPGEAVDAAIRVLADVAGRRHGPFAVIRAFCRAERAPESVAVF